MSVTFSTNVQPLAFALECADGVVRAAGSFPTWADADAVAAGHVCSAAECRDFGGWALAVPVYAPGVPADLNVSNSNAAYLLDVLGIDVGLDFADRCAGSVCGGDFLGRVLLAEAILPADAGVPEFTTRPGEVRCFVDCGRRPGYGQDRLVVLRQLAEYAAANDCDVLWG